MKKAFPVIFTLVLAGAVFWSQGLRKDFQAQTQEPALDLKEIRTVYPGASEFRYRTSPFPHYALYEKDGGTGRKNLSGYAFLTTDVAPQVTGYAGPIMALVGMDLTGKITGVRILEHSETFSYVDRMTQTDWLKQFLGLNRESPMLPGEGIDGISGATVSVEALCRSVKQGLDQMATRVLGNEERKYEERPPLPRATSRLHEAPTETKETQVVLRGRAKVIQEVLLKGKLKLTPSKYYRTLEEETS